MDNPEAKLRDIIQNETIGISTNGDVIYSLIEIIRSLDYQTFMLGHFINPNDEYLLEKYKLGWALPFACLYKELTLGEVPIFVSTELDELWSNSIIIHGSSIQLCNQLLDYTKAGFMELQSNNDNSFTFIPLFQDSSEIYERLSMSYYQELMNKILEKKTHLLLNQLPKMRIGLQDIVKLEFENFISYQATQEVDDFYSKFGHLYMMTTQIIDEFDEKDVFGTYRYKDYLDVAEYIIKAGIMHRDCCMALAEKTSHKVYLRNILSYAFSFERFINSFSEYIGWEKEKCNEIFSCFSLNKDNYSYHLSYPKASPPPYIQLGKDTWIMSTHGCLERPIYLLNRELKRKYPKDYFEAVNMREERFREQLYDFFNQDKIIKIRKSIIIKSFNIVTDIDGVVFDSEKKILGLFQLKWQDSFHNSMKERYSRITNLIPKSVEWIDKVENWIKTNDSKTILNTLQIKGESNVINEIYLFVVSRNHVHFTNQYLDERAIWASWFQVIEASAKIKDPSNSNPIGEFAAKLKFFSPEYRKNMDNIPKQEDFDFKIADYKISVKGK